MIPRLHTPGIRLLFVLLLPALLAGCSPRGGEALVAKVGDTPITLREYEELYLKSSGSREEAAAAPMEERERFLGLMTNFRLKLADAYRSGLDRRPEILAEMRQYKGSLAQSYLTDRAVTAPGTRRLFERRSEEIRAAHILLTLAPGAPAEDSAIAYGKAADLIRRIQGGADFSALATEFSQDPSVSQNRGDLYYFTGGQMVPAFEDAVYALKIGEVTPAPVRTQYGLHIIKVLDRKPAPGEVQCSHIMIRFPRQDPEAGDTLEALRKIRAIQDSIRMGVDFAELATRNSGDPGSAPKGGDLGWFTRRRWVQSFDEVAVTMKPGQISDVVRTIYGYHLIKCTDARPPKSFAESQKDLQQMYQQVRFQEDYGTFLARLKKETGYAMDDSVAALLFTSLDSTGNTRDTTWADSLSPAVRVLPLFRFGARTVSVDSTIRIMRSRPDMGGVPLRAAPMRNSLEKVGEQLIFEVKAETIEKDHPEFAAIMKEYNEGILLYQIEQERVWNRVAVTDSGLAAYFAANRDKFRYPERLDITVLRVANDSLASAFYEQINAGMTLEAVAAADSARMKQTSSFPLTFRGKSSTLLRETLLALAGAAKQLKAEPALRAVVTSLYDTSARKSPNETLARRRADAVKTYLKEKLGVSDARVTTQVRAAAAGKEETGKVTLDVIGRRAAVIGAVENLLLPTDTDERTEPANALAPGGVAEPFLHQGAVHIIRLNRREPARDKTFEEAGTEVSSAFQEYESRRIEQEWLEGLRKTYPVTEYREVLQNAFAPLP